MRHFMVRDFFLQTFFSALFHDFSLVFHLRLKEKIEREGGRVRFRW